jgi:hypothetical protein
MIEKFEGYLGLLPLTRIIKDRIDEIIKLNLKIVDEEINDIFICEFKNNEGVRTYTSLWLFCHNNCIECKTFLHSYDFDITPYFKKVDYCSITSSEFDFENTSEISSVKVHFRFATGISGDLIGTEQNCLKAFEIYKRFIIPNLVKHDD